MICPNRHPTQAAPYRIALIGEAPGSEEERLGQPFVGMSGRFLAALCSRAGIPLSSCFVGNISQHRPPSNDISMFSWNGLEIQHGLDKLREDIESFKPNLVVLLGNVPLKAAKDFDSPLAKKHAFSNSNWRGSIFRCEEADSPFFGYKCMATYHPAYVLRDYDVCALLQFDLKKAARHGMFSETRLPERILTTQINEQDICSNLSQIRKDKTKVAIDIEGGIDTMSCISFATAPNTAFIVPFYQKDGSKHQANTWQVWKELVLTLEDSNVPKVLQNALYDRFVLAYSYGIRVRGIEDDTMLKHWELYSELEKSLGVQASIYTDEPYYKGHRKSNDDRQFYEYCCRDSGVTLEISNKLDGYLNGVSLEHYRQNVALLNPMLYMELRGIKYDEAGALARRTLLQQKLYESQARLNALTNRGFGFKSVNEIHNRARELMCFVKAQALSFDPQNAKKSHYAEAQRLAILLRLPEPDLATIGEIEDLCEVSLNVSSSKQFVPFLYEELKLPTQYSEKRGEDPHPTADYEALLKLNRELQKDPDKYPASYTEIIRLAMDIRSLQTRQQMLSISADRDGRIRCGYNLVGSNTGRVACYESPTGSGYNLQTIPKYTDVKEAPGGVLGDRDLFMADPEHWFFQCDLAGADGWTVAAYSAMLGDDTLLEDYRYGLKPARNLALILRGLASETTDRATLKELGKKVSGDDWDYFAAKRVQHGCSYLEGALTVSRNILKDSEGKLYMSVPECEKLKKAFFTRYRGILAWHEWIGRRLKERPVLTAASGQVRQFFGRPDEIITKAVAFEPQANTTYATNLAMYKLWTDIENRQSLLDTGTQRGFIQKSSPLLPRVRLKIEPLHQVHDALCGQFLKRDTAWSIGKIQQWFANPLQIAGQAITIPFDGAYGPSWGQQGEKYGGGKI